MGGACSARDAESPYLGDRWNDEAYTALNSWGVAVAWTSESFPVTHEKSIVVDDSAALIATFNLSDKCFASVITG